MLKFADLTMAQKKCVVALIEAQPSLKKTGKISLKEVVSITQDLASKRGSGGVKIGYPNWLFKSNKVERGVYQLPVPTATELSDYQKELDAKLNPVVKAKAKVAKLAKAKTVKVKTSKPAKVQKEDKLEKSKLQKIIDESDSGIDADVEDFNQILKENGITV